MNTKFIPEEFPKLPKVTYIDPPSGWRYGFPKILPDYVINVKAWLLDNGYPQSEIDNGGMRYRTFIDNAPKGWL